MGWLQPAGISDSFQLLLTRLEPRETELRRAQRHADSIESRLGKDFNLRKFELAGSHARGTAIAGVSDVDYFAVVARDDARWGGSFVNSNTLMGNVRDSLMTRYPGTEIARDGQAVVVAFADELDVDVVPALFQAFEEKHPVYAIPDGNGGWLRSSPSAHNSYIAREDQRSGGKLKYTAKLLKIWRDCRQPRIPLSSFHIELALASTGTCVGVQSYSQTLTGALKLLTDRQLASLRDPLAISGFVPAVNTAAQAESAYRSLANSFRHASDALSAEIDGNIREARRQWEIVFNNQYGF